MNDRNRAGGHMADRGRMFAGELIAFRDRRTGRMRRVGSREALPRPAHGERDGNGDLPDLDLLVALKGRRN